MSAVDLEPGWLKRQMDDVAALGRARRKIMDAASNARANGDIQSMTVEFTIAELMAIDYMTRMCAVNHPSQDMPK